MSLRMKTKTGTDPTRMWNGSDLKYLHDEVIIGKLSRRTEPSLGYD